MLIGRAQKRIILYLILPALLVVVGLRFYAQFRHVDVFVSRVAPMPSALANGLHMEEHKISPLVRIESPYDRAPDQLVPPGEIHRLRSAIAWGSSLPLFIDSLTILSPTNALGRQNNKTSIKEYQIAKRAGRWRVEGVTRRQVRRGAPE